jgi:hypothetical protein
MDKLGKTVIREVIADTPTGARAILLATGYTDLELMDEAIIPASDVGFFEWPALCGQAGEEPPFSSTGSLEPRGRTTVLFDSAGQIKASVASFSVRFYRWLRHE